MKVLDLFSAAAGGWSLGLHRAGFETVAACEWIDWRRALYAENNPGVLIYDDVRTLTADRLRADLGTLPDIVVGSPPCQDISSANTKGKGVEGERSGLFFEAIRIIGEVRPRWIALENSANLRTRGADAVLSALEDLDYACWATVVRAGNIGANHERPRSWIIGCDVEQLADAPQVGCAPWAGDRQSEHTGLNGSLAGHDNGDGDAAYPDSYTIRLAELSRRSEQKASVLGDADQARSAPHAHQAGQADGPLVASLRQAEVADDGCGAGRRADGQGVGQVGIRPSDRLAALQHRADWSLDDLARHIRLDDGLPAWLAEQRIAVGGPRGTSAASLVVEAFGDAVIPQIPEAIGRAILRVEAAMAAVARPERIAA